MIAQKLISSIIALKSAEEWRAEHKMEYEISKAKRKNRIYVTSSHAVSYTHLTLPTIYSV